MRLVHLLRSDIIKLAVRYGSFLLVTAAIWSGYFTWRPPAPMLGLRHVEHLERDSPHVALTIDDAPHPFTTPLLLAALRRANVKATFFVVGDGMRLYPELAQRIVGEGHRLANHSQYHHNLARISPAEYEHEIDTCFAAIGRAGQSTRLFRPPGGGLNRDVMRYLYDNDVTLAWWSNNVGDWSPQPAWKIARRVEAQLRPGDILLLHDAMTSTPQAIPAIVKAVRRRGLDFVVMPEANGVN
ncbi:MAG TPA: polysaccharide deacetylase family protein [Abditibacteriaceae bacterium]|nr:polysaccharide deacetylase family protein [Abditibacteriaceae bacterium]